ncbi:hypothetical protein Tco_0059293 [Tanacetum coccineum]
MDREVKRLKQSRIPIVKVRWNSKRGPDFTWDDELMFDTGVLDADEMPVEAKVDEKDEQSTKLDDSTAGEAVTTASVEDSVAPTTMRNHYGSGTYQSKASKPKVVTTTTKKSRNIKRKIEDASSVVIQITSLVIAPKTLPVIKRHSLSEVGAIVEMTQRKKRFVSWLTQTRLEVNSLKLKLASFENSSSSLQKMVEMQKPSKDKCGLGYTETIASPRNTKIKNLGGHLKKLSVEPAGRCHSSTAPACSIEQHRVSDDSAEKEKDLETNVRQKVKLDPDEWIQDSGCTRHMTGNKDLFSSYKTFDRGNVLFGSNTKSKIIGKEDRVFESTNSVPTKKASHTQIGEYEMCAIRIKQYFQIQDYALWEVIENGDSWVSISQTTEENGITISKMSTPANATKEDIEKQYSTRVCLLIGIPNDNS